MRVLQRLRRRPERAGQTTRVPDVTWQRSWLRTDNDLDALLSQLVDTVRAAGYPDRDVFAIQVAIVEAAANAIRHGHQGDARKIVEVRHSITANEIRIEIEDQGPGFDPAAVRSRTPASLRARI